LWRLQTFIAGILPVMVILLLCATFPSIRADQPCPNVPPVAAFTFFPPMPHCEEMILFDASESYDLNGFIFSYTWDFGDGNVTVISVHHLTHSYANPGEYNVSLTVLDNLGATNSTSQTVFVRTCIVASFSFSPPNPYVREIVTFDASNSTTTAEAIVSYEWNFGDGNSTIVEVMSTTHYYNEAKDYNVTLKVTDSSGAWDVASQIINVTAPSGGAPEANFTWAPVIPEAGQLVEFNASESTPNGGEIVSYYWDFGDGDVQTSDQPIVDHIYSEFGSYLVLLDVTDSEGLSDSVNHSIHVIAKPVADFFFLPEEPRVCSIVTFNASLSDPRGGNIVSFEWIFGDNVSAESGAVVTHRFSRMGETFVYLSVTDSEGLWDVKNVTLNILPHIADLNEDGVVNILDISIFAGAYGSFPSNPRWLPRADLDGNEIVNILDGVVIARSYNMCIDPFDC
jgi:PKD repeat protein